MLKLITISLIIFCVSFNSHSQTKWNLDECIQYTKKNNVDIQKKRLEIESSKINLSESKWSYAPSLYANSSYNISQGRVLDPTTYEFIENQIVQGNNTSISASMDIFQGFKSVNTIKKNALQLQHTILEVQSLENNLMFNVTAYYLDVLLASESITNCEQVVLSLDAQRKNITKMVEVGRVTTADLFQIESQLADAKTNLLTAKNQLYIAKLKICQLMNIDDYMSFEITSVDSSVLVNPITLPHINTVLYNANFLPELEAARIMIDIRKKDLNITNSSYYPSISLSASYGSSYSNVRQKGEVNTDGLLKYGAYPFIEQYRDNLNGYIAVGISIPIFNKFFTHKNIQRGKIAIKQAELSLKSMEKQINKDVNQVYIDISISWQKYNSTKMYLKSSTEALRQIEKKYNLGVATIVDYNAAMDNYINALSKHSQAKYEYIFKTRIINFYLGYSK